MEQTDETLEPSQAYRPKRRSSRSFLDNPTIRFVVRVALASASVIAVLLIGFLIFSRLQGNRSERADVAADETKEEKPRDSNSGSQEIDYSHRKPQWTQYDYKLADVSQMFPVVNVFNEIKNEKEGKYESARTNNYFYWRFGGDLSEFATEQRNGKLMFPSVEDSLDRLLNRVLAKKINGKVESKSCQTTDLTYVFHYVMTYDSPPGAERMWVKLTYFRNSKFALEQFVAIPRTLPKPVEVDQFFESVAFGPGVLNGR